MKTFKEYMYISETKNLIESKYNADDIRRSMPGIVGPDFAKKALDDDDIIKMAGLVDKKSKAYNTHILPLLNDINKLRKKYRLKPVNSDMKVK